MSELGGAKLLMFAARSQDLRVYSDLADKLEGTAKAAALAFDDVQKLVRASLPTVFESQNCENVPMRTLSSRIAIWRDNLNTDQRLGRSTKCDYSTSIRRTGHHC